MGNYYNATIYQSFPSISTGENKGKGMLNIACAKFPLFNSTSSPVSIFVPIHKKGMEVY
jgi:hypothetical protein